MIKRKKYAKGFKLDAISLVLDQRYTRIEAARSLDINANMLGRWIKEHQGDGQAFRGNGKLTPEQEAIRKLKAQVKQLQLEKRILKEATVFFAKETKQNTCLLPQRRRPSVGLMCRLLGVTRSGYHGHQPRQKNRSTDFYHQEMIEAVKDIAKASDNSYGSRRVRKALNALSYPVSRNKARTLMKEAGVVVKHRKKYKVTTNSNHNQPVFENMLNRRFEVSRPTQVYAGDLTYLWTQEG